MWNDTDIPLAIFFTIRCYGTWLHGDEHGSVDRNNNIYGTPRIAANSNWRKHNEAVLRHPPVKLNAAERSSVEKAIHDTCDLRKWYLHAVNFRTIHGHVGAAIGRDNARNALSSLKANATRQLREDGLWPHRHSPWADKGSRRILWNERSVWEACDYVMNRQGEDLAKYDWW